MPLTKFLGFLIAFSKFLPEEAKILPSRGNLFAYLFIFFLWKKKNIKKGH